MSSDTERDNALDTAEAESMLARLISRLPDILAWGACIFFLVFMVFDLPELMMPRALAVVQNVGALDEDLYEDEETDKTVIPDQDAAEVYVRYVAMGEERAAFLPGADNGLKKGDRLMVAYSEEDPYDITALSTGRYIFDAVMLVACAAGFIALWTRDARKNKKQRRHFTLSE